MLDGLPTGDRTPLALGSLSNADLTSPWWIVGFAVFLLLVGWLVPKRSVDRVERDRDHWRDAHGLLAETIRELQSQNGELLEQSRVTVALLQSLAGRPPRAEDSS